MKVSKFTKSALCVGVGDGKLIAGRTEAKWQKLNDPMWSDNLGLVYWSIHSVGIIEFTKLYPFD
ncbi:hypothetical protein DND62_30805 [Pseudomonas syringae pv. pisi]|uniref:Uncharacterized protein n=1 Tax=Candidozyma auris TaxID=498019 RepID=A0A0L0P8F8_CANAR|nr:hypothetical protein DND62_30805 [Pseudomonas syringae pv. pisi]